MSPAAHGMAGGHDFRAFWKAVINVFKSVQNINNY
jgi:hypothetical protein